MFGSFIVPPVFLSGDDRFRQRESGAEVSLFGVVLSPLPKDNLLDANSSILAKVKKIANSVQLPALVPAFA